jgi:NADPH:quinone reductase
VKAVVLRRLGGPEELRTEEVSLRRPGPGEVRVDIAAAGVNFMDVGTRTGLNTLRPLPLTPGVEGAGRVAELGEGVTGLSVGQRVAWFFVIGSYAEQVIAPADALVPLPDGIPDEVGAAVMMQGLTALNLTQATYKVQPGDVALVHSAAGGVGLMLTQIVKLLGGTVIGRVSSEAKAALARAAGADHVIVAADGEVSERVLALTGGEGVHVAYDGAGADTFAGSLASLRYHGVLAYYGQTIKRLPPIDLLDLPRSVLVTYPVVHHLVRTPEALAARSRQLFGWILEGRLRVELGGRYPLDHAPRAHVDLQSRRTVGKLLLVP